MRTTLVRRLAAWGLALAFAGSLTLPALSARHLAPDAEDRLVPVREHALVGVPDEAAPGDAHCPICHWLHAVSGAFAQVAGAHSVPPTLGIPDLPVLTGRHGRAEGPALPSRGPPSLV